MPIYSRHSVHTAGAEESVKKLFLVQVKNIKGIYFNYEN